MLIQEKINKAYRAVFILSLAYTITAALSFVFPPKQFEYSTVLYDKNGLLLGASTSVDGQWHFENSKVPEKFEKSILNYEDSRFYFHFGIDPIALARAFVQNKKAGKIVSGGSTLTMQTARILLGNKKRTYLQKLYEIFVATCIEMKYSKKQIISIYASSAPFGGNVIGLEAASWRYYNRPSDSLSWAEYATLAVLPNQPSLVRPGKNKEILLEKRNRLLWKLCTKKIIDLETYKTSILEELPGKPYQLPSLAPHYLEELKKKKQNKGMTIFKSTLDYTIQDNANRITGEWSKNFKLLGIENASILVINTKTKEPLAYVGNTTSSVNMVEALRSSGSLLKPFLYAAMIDNGMLLPKQIVYDVPTRIGNYSPKNNINNYSGAIPADQALTRSLNIPAVRELKKYGITQFLSLLSKYGITTLKRNADYYGLPLILGGGEIKMKEIAGAYADLMNKACGRKTNIPINEGTAWTVCNVLSDGVRPMDLENWLIYSRRKKIAWKTGTSSGNRDAWCIGTTPEYTVAAWVGNSSGIGNKMLTSATTAAPLMFEVFSILPQTTWPSRPEMEFEEIETCEQSGYAASPYCSSVKKSLKPVGIPQTENCPYCNSYTFTPDGKFLASVEDMINEYEGYMPKSENRFVLPPYVEYWFKKQNLHYKSLPPFIEWHRESSENNIHIEFPQENSEIIVPVELGGKKGSVIFEAAVKNSASILYWDIDGNYLGCTEKEHKMAVSPNPGLHTLTLSDTSGSIKKRQFKVLEE
ncbi:MAG: penicillin-binding protein 1C [Spirochaetia bacterium]|nr:penicillin-binding protein 1C [uncultured Treponema sp.]MCI6442594.1 penicillin-binding protein 1C [Spirochaetia bacterium]